MADGAAFFRQCFTRAEGAPLCRDVTEATANGSAGEGFFQSCATAPDGGAPICETHYPPPPTAEGVSTAESSPETSGLMANLSEWAAPILNNPVDWLQNTVLKADVLMPIGIQLAAIFAVIIAGRMLAAPLERLLQIGLSRLPQTSVVQKIDDVLHRLTQPAVSAILLYGAQFALMNAGQQHVLVRVAAFLAVATLLIRLGRNFLPSSMQRPVSTIAWAVAFLGAFNILDDLIRWSDTLGPTYADQRINPGFIIKAVITAALFIYGAHWLSKRLKSRVETLPKVEPSIRILMMNAIQIGLFLAAGLLTMAGLGIPLSGLAILGGAIGVGLGFGMQQIVANFISGVILLTDRSIKPDDVIEVDETYGVVQSLGLRYASVITRDGKEHLIPNEMLVTNKVVNWSYSNKQVRIKRRFLVEYESDLRLAAQLCVDAAADQERVLSDPEPKCLIMEFGEDAIIMEARFWIADPQNGINNIGSAVMFAMWDKFKEHGIDLPLAQDEIRIVPDSVLKVQMTKDAD